MLVPAPAPKAPQSIRSPRGTAAVHEPSPQRTATPKARSPDGAPRRIIPLDASPGTARKVQRLTSRSQAPANPKLKATRPPAAEKNKQKKETAWPIDGAAQVANQKVYFSSFFFFREI